MFRASGSDYVLTRWLFLRLLGVLYLIAFLSLFVQIPGLIGSDGIWPAARFLDAAARQLDRSRFWEIPTVFWLGAGDGALRLACGSGIVLSGLLALGVAPFVCTVLLWVLYLSLVQVGGVFLSFQWDTLLLETGLLAMLLAPLHPLPRPSLQGRPSFPAVLSLRWLLCKLMFLSGLVKLTSGDAAWRHLTALTVHYETPPPPAWPRSRAHQQPLWFAKASCLLVFLVELVLPFFVFGPRRLRLIACGGFVLLQFLIGATGNYGFFNLNAVLLCVMLLDDRLLSRLLPERARAWFLPPEPKRARRPVPGTVLAGALFALSATVFVGEFAGYGWLPRKGFDLVRAAAPFRSINGYGLFRVMTTEQPEIEIQGSNDGTTWTPYRFRWKPGDPARKPRFVEPHMPRLDWQMWFAALGGYRRNPWLVRMMQKLTEGSPDVVALLGENPFPGAPPRYVRAVLWRYRFTTRAGRRETGDWWVREWEGLYAPVVSREERERPAGGT